MASIPSAAFEDEEQELLRRMKSEIERLRQRRKREDALAKILGKKNPNISYNKPTRREQPPKAKLPKRKERAKVDLDGYYLEINFSPEDIPPPKITRVDANHMIVHQHYLKPSIYLQYANLAFKELTSDVLTFESAVLILIKISEFLRLHGNIEKRKIWDGFQTLRTNLANYSDLILNRDKFTQYAKVIARSFHSSGECLMAMDVKQFSILQSKLIHLNEDILRINTFHKTKLTDIDKVLMDIKLIKDKSGDNTNYIKYKLLELVGVWIRLSTIEKISLNCIDIIKIIRVSLRSYSYIIAHDRDVVKEEDGKYHYATNIGDAMLYWLADALAGVDLELTYKFAQKLAELKRYFGSYLESKEYISVLGPRLILKFKSEASASIFEQQLSSIYKMRKDNKFVIFNVKQDFLEADFKELAEKLRIHMQLATRRQAAAARNRYYARKYRPTTARRF